MSDIIILPVPVFSTLANAAFALRKEVFVWEQKVPETVERDSYDLTATHYVAIAEGNVIGTLRLIEQPEHIKIGRVAVHHSWRGQGVARQLVEKAMTDTRALGHARFYLTAQSDKLGLYEKLGFIAFGPEFIEGGMPHRAMRDYDKVSATLTN